jgi:hypothetical protein
VISLIISWNNVGVRIRRKNISRFYQALFLHCLRLPSSFNTTQKAENGRWLERTRFYVEPRISECLGNIGAVIPEDPIQEELTRHCSPVLHDQTIHVEEHTTGSFAACTLVRSTHFRKLQSITGPGGIAVCSAAGVNSCVMVASRLGASSEAFGGHVTSTICLRFVLGLSYCS